jgi:hypothetical protein
MLSDLRASRVVSGSAQLDCLGYSTCNVVISKESSGYPHSTGLRAEQTEVLSDSLFTRLKQRLLEATERVSSAKYQRSASVQIVGQHRVAYVPLMTSSCSICGSLEHTV